MLKDKKELYLLMDDNHYLKLNQSLDKITDLIDIKKVELGEIYFHKRPYVVLDKRLFLSYIDNIKIIQSDTTSRPKTSDISKEPSRSFWSSIQKKTKPTIDWHDHYLEGLRIHGSKDDAEAHADDQLRKR